MLYDTVFFLYHDIDPHLGACQGRERFAPRARCAIETRLAGGDVVTVDFAVNNVLQEDGTAPIGIQVRYLG